jgi:hypothetical protein
VKKFFALKITIVVVVAVEKKLFVERSILTYQKYCLNKFSRVK